MRGGPLASQHTSAGRQNNAASDGGRPTQAHPLRQTRHWLLVAGVIVIAVLLRVAFLGAKSFDIDEAASITWARLGWTAFLRALAWDANMWLYYALLRLWAHLGDSETVLRSLSVIFDVATLPVVYALGARLFGRTVGLYALVLLCVNAFHIAYAQNARSYSLAVFLVALSSLFFVRGIERHSWQDWVGYVLTSVLAVYSHIFAGLALVAQWISLAFLPPRQVPWKSLSVSIVLIAFLPLPLGVFVVTKTAMIPHPNLKDVAGLFYDLTGGADPRNILLRAPSVMYLIICLSALAAAARLWASRKASREGWYYGFLLAWLWIPILLAFSVSAIKPIFLRRYLIICLPPLVLLAAVGLSRIRPRWAFVAALTVLLGLALHGVYYYYTDTPYFTGDQDTRAATRHILDHAEPGDAVLFYASEMEITFSYYRGRFRGSANTPSITMLPDKAWQGPPPEYRRVWLFLSHGDPREQQSIQAWLASHYAAMAEQQFLGVQVLLYSKPVFAR